MCVVFGCRISTNLKQRVEWLQFLGTQQKRYFLHISGKGVNIWDTLTHERSQLVVDLSSGDVADDSYHLYKEDVKLLKNMGVSP